MPAHFYSPETSTIEQSHIKGYGLAGWYYFANEVGSEVVGPFESAADAEEAWRKSGNPVRRDDLDGW